MSGPNTDFTRTAPCSGRYQVVIHHQDNKEGGDSADANGATRPHDVPRSDTQPAATSSSDFSQPAVQILHSGQSQVGSIPSVTPIAIHLHIDPTAPSTLPQSPHVNIAATHRVEYHLHVHLHDATGSFCQHGVMGPTEMADTTQQRPKRARGESVGLSEHRHRLKRRCAIHESCIQLESHDGSCRSSTEVETSAVHSHDSERESSASTAELATGGTSIITSPIDGIPPDDQSDRSPTRSPQSNGSPSATTPNNASSILEEQLQHVFGHASFRDGQLDVIQATMSARDCLATFPTGLGKTLCFALPASLESRDQRLTVVITPTCALMDDQISALRKRGLQASALHGGTPESVRTDVLLALSQPDTQKELEILFLCPEQLRHNTNLQKLLKRLSDKGLFARLVIDEAHCLVTWGFDFRPDYLYVRTLRARDWPHTTVLALTATATPSMKDAIVDCLSMAEDTVFFSSSMDRINLTYEVISKDSSSLLASSGADKHQAGSQSHVYGDCIAKLIKSTHRRQRGMIFCRTKNSCDELAEFLTAAGISAVAYHRDLDVVTQKARMEQWLTEGALVIVGTVALSMGIDVADVRFVIHHDMPASLVNYAQETGRAGRDGQSARCYVYFSVDDVLRFRQSIYKSCREETQNTATLERLATSIMSLDDMAKFCINRLECRHKLLLEHFGEQGSHAGCQGHCDNCQQNGRFELRDFTELARTAINIVGLLTDSGERPTIHDVASMLVGKQYKWSNRRKADMERLQAQARLSALVGCGRKLSATDARSFLLRLALVGALKLSMWVSKQYPAAITHIECNKSCRSIDNFYMECATTAQSFGSWNTIVSETVPTSLLSAANHAESSLVAVEQHYPSSRTSALSSAARTSSPSSVVGIMGQLEVAAAEGAAILNASNDTRSSLSMSSPLKRQSVHTPLTPPSTQSRGHVASFSPSSPTPSADSQASLSAGVPRALVPQSTAFDDEARRSKVNRFIDLALTKRLELMTTSKTNSLFSESIIKQMASLMPMEHMAVYRLPGVDKMDAFSYGRIFCNLWKSIDE